MRNSFYIFLCAGAFAFASCNKTEKTDSDTATVIENDNTTSGRADTEAMYRDRAEKTTRRMAGDLRFDTDNELQTNVRNTYYTRATRMDEVRNRYTGDTTGMYLELRKVELDTDREFQRILKPEQYTVYERNRTTYMGGFDNPEMLSETKKKGRSVAGIPISDNATVKTKTDKDGDTKIEIEDGNKEIKIKRDADGETKVKTSIKD